MIMLEFQESNPSFKLSTIIIVIPVMTSYRWEIVMLTIDMYLIHLSAW